MIRIRLYRSIGIIAILAVAAIPCFAGEVAVLKNGFAIRHERREVVGDVTRLYVNADGSSFVDVPTAQVDHYEAAPDAPATKAAAPGPGQPGTAARLSAAGLSAPRTANARNSTAFMAAGVSNHRMDLTEVVKDASGRYQLDPDLVNSVIKAESGFNARAISPKGAQGLMQLMPGTATQLGVPNAFDPQANVDGGTKYLRELLEKYNFDLVKALAAYNAGPQRVEHFGGVPPYYETRAYVARIVRDFNKKKLAQQNATAAARKQAASKEAAAKTHTAARKHSPSGTLQAKTGQQSE